jgi:DNA-binding transcriptional ArsR family regulator
VAAESQSTESQSAESRDSLDQDHVFLALAHPVRRRILDVLKASPGCSVADVCAHFEMSRIGVMKHLKVLERADLVISEKVGRTRELHFNVVPIQIIYDRWTTELSALWARRLTDLKYRVESQGDNADS